jgi:hypothetical protein
MPGMSWNFFTSNPLSSKVLRIFEILEVAPAIPNGEVRLLITRSISIENVKLSAERIDAKDPSTSMIEGAFSRPS